MEQGQTLPQDALAAQQAMEEALGIKQPLDQSYQEAKDLARTHGTDARRIRKPRSPRWSRNCRRNPQMQRALGHIAEQTAAGIAKPGEHRPDPAGDGAGASGGGRALTWRAWRVTNCASTSRRRPGWPPTRAGRLQQVAQAAKKDPATEHPENCRSGGAGRAAGSPGAAEAARTQAENTPAPSSFFDAAKGAMLAQALDQT